MRPFLILAIAISVWLSGCKALIPSQGGSVQVAQREAIEAKLSGKFVTATQPVTLRGSSRYALTDELSPAERGYLYEQLASFLRRTYPSLRMEPWQVDPRQWDQQGTLFVLNFHFESGGQTSTTVVCQLSVYDRTGQVSQINSKRIPIGGDRAVAAKLALQEVEAVATALLR
jgi:hypothetical protein